MKAAQQTGHGANLEASLDPYAHLKAAHAAGKVIQFRLDRSDSKWEDCHPLYNRPVAQYRIKPEPPPFALPPPPPGMQWHREDGWKEGDLPEGTRPHCLGEVVGGEGKRNSDGEWCPLAGLEAAQSTHTQLRTTRPLVFTHAGKSWTWHRPGDPMPCDGERKVFVLLQNHEESDWPLEAGRYDWGTGFPVPALIIGWRYAEPEAREVELGPEDVPPGSVIRMEGTAYWVQVIHCGPASISYHTGGFHEVLLFSKLNSDRWKINRSLPLTGKWNPEAWEPCSKTIPATSQPN